MATRTEELEQDMLEFIGDTDKETHVDEYRAAFEKAMDFFNVKGFEAQE